MTVYITKVWGFHVPCGPLTFSKRGWRDRAREVLRTGDLVVTVGTKADPTAVDDQGRLLGIMEPTTEPVSSLDYDLQTRPQDFDEAGNYKWPFGLLNKNAWKIPERPPLSRIAPRRFEMDAVEGIVALTDEEAARVMALTREEIPLLLPSPNTQRRLEAKHGVSRRIAPPPSTTQRRGVMHMRKAPAETYAMEIVGAKPRSFKIGWAFDHAQRARQFNQVAMSEIGGLQYKPFLFQRWNTAREAYAMEQRLLAHFEAHRHPMNHEIVHGLSDQELQAAWLLGIRGQLSPE